MALFIFILVGLGHLIIQAGLPSLDVKQTDRAYILIHCVFKLHNLLYIVQCRLSVKDNHPQYHTIDMRYSLA